MALSHLDEQGRARMVDVSGKDETLREAMASGCVHARPRTLTLIRHQGLAKGDVLNTARIAGIQAAKQCAHLIPLCHSLPLTDVEIDFELCADTHVAIRATCRTRAGTGVEMEALTAVSVAALTLYDMCKAEDKTMRIDAVQLEHKKGGRNGTWHRDAPRKEPIP